jgi:hypothetical protein
MDGSAAVGVAGGGEFGERFSAAAAAAARFL